MKLSTKGRYGLKSIFELVLYEDQQEPLALKMIAEKNGLSELYLEQIFAKLKKADLVKSVRGAQGGYYLSRPSDEITVGEVLRALEGPMVPSECVLEEYDNCGTDFCATKSVWKRIKDSVDQVIDTMTLGDMLREHRLENTDNETKEM